MTWRDNLPRCDAISATSKRRCRGPGYYTRQFNPATRCYDLTLCQNHYYVQPLPAHWTLHGPTRPLTLYRCYDAADRLLYVGITGNLTVRLRAHSHRKPWWPDTARVASEQIDVLDRFDAEDQERAVIVAERPLHNIRGHPDTTYHHGIPVKA